MNDFIQKLRKVKVDSWLGACAGVLVVLLAVQGVAYVRVRAMGSEFADALLAQSAAPTRGESSKLEDYQSIMGKGVFGKKQPPPAPKLFGLLDGSALMGEEPNKVRTYELNADLPGGFKLVEIGFNSVVVEREDKRETIRLFPGLTDKVDAPRMPPPGRGPRGPGREARPPGQPAPPQAAEVPQGRRAMEVQMDGAIPKEVRQAMEEARRMAQQAAEQAMQQARQETAARRVRGQ